MKASLSSLFRASGRVLVAISLVASGLVGFGAILTETKSVAADLSQFDAGNIISDEVFYNGSALSAADVQLTLNQRVPTCTINNGQASHAAGSPWGSTTISDVCLKDYVQATPNMAAQQGLCSAYTGSAQERASDIIAKVGAACNISQKVLLVLLEKEQSLVSDSWPTVRQINQATGFACYDNGQPCVQTYSGFFYQVWSAAKQLQVYGTSPFTWYPVGKVSNVLYQANRPDCGTKPINIQNRATAALYYYTPYTPNAAALAAGYGLGDSCSAYGNRNFFQLYTDWFGSTHYVAPAIAGAWETMICNPGQFRITGWLLYPGAQSVNSTVIFSVDGVRQITTVANGANNGSLASYPDAGSNHGYTALINASAGQHTVCGFPQTQAGANISWGCTGVNVLPAIPIAGAWETLTGTPGKINITGWLLYPGDQGANASVVFSVDGVRQTATVANGANNGSVASYPDAGSNHGYTANMTATAGRHSVCGFPQTQGGANINWGCTGVTVPADIPTAGAWETMTGTPGQINITGWLLYPSNPSANASVVFSIDGVRQTATVANGANNGSLANFPDAGANHGYTATLGASAGNHTVCGFPQTQGGANVNWGCTGVSVPVSQPIAGAWETMTGTPGQINITGWLLYPSDQAANASVIFSVDGVRQTAAVANGTNNDSLTNFPGAGPNHGYTATINASSGRHTICGFPQTQSGTSVNWGCTPVTVP